MTFIGNIPLEFVSEVKEIRRIFVMTHDPAEDGGSISGNGTRLRAISSVLGNAYFYFLLV
jgi:hypothetical protein